MAVIAAYMLPHPPLIVPQIGRGEERLIQKTIDAYGQTAQKIAAQGPETIVVLSPHQVMYADYFHISPGRSAAGDFGQFRAGDVSMEVSYDREFVERLCSLTRASGFPAGTQGEQEKRLDHGTMVPLYFVNHCWKEYRLVRIGLSGLSFEKHYELGQYIQQAAAELGRRTIVIASGDLSHRLKEDGPYGYREEGPAYDSRIMDVMSKGAFGELFAFPETFCDRAGECGHRSFVIMAGALDGMAVISRPLSYEGPFGVGYGICEYEVTGSDAKRRFGEIQKKRERARLQKCKEQEDAYVRLARRTIETYIRTGVQIKVPDALPQEMYERCAGVFVSIKEDGRLRGCIGTIRPLQASVAEEIVHNAVSASTQDPRFSPIREEELERLTISVDVLGDTEKVTSTAQLDVKRYGVIVTKGQKRGLLLPNLDGVDSVEEQIAIARQKAGIGEKESVELERFEVVRHG